MITVDDFLWFVDEALDGMVELVAELGDDLANRRPDLPAANSPFAILTHCLGVMAYWGGYAIAGRTVDRDRAAEFVSSGSVVTLVAAARAARAVLAEDLANFEAEAPPRGAVRPEDVATPLGRTQGGVLVHIYEELAQHRGQMEITADLLRSG